MKKFILFCILSFSTIYSEPAEIYMDGDGIIILCAWGHEYYITEIIHNPMCDCYPTLVAEILP
jgi:hypothetical protein